MERAHQQIHHRHSAHRRGALHRHAEHVPVAAEKIGPQGHHCERRRGGEAEPPGHAGSGIASPGAGLDVVRERRDRLLSHGRIGRGGATRHPSRCGPWGRGRATDTCPTDRPGRAHRSSRCGRRRRLPAQRCSCLAARAHTRSDRHRPWPHSARPPAEPFSRPSRECPARSYIRSRLGAAAVP